MNSMKKIAIMFTIATATLNICSKTPTAASVAKAIGNTAEDLPVNGIGSITIQSIDPKALYTIKQYPGIMLKKGKNILNYPNGVGNILPASGNIVHAPGFSITPPLIDKKTNQFVLSTSSLNPYKGNVILQKIVQKGSIWTKKQETLIYYIVKENSIPELNFTLYFNNNILVERIPDLIPDTKKPSNGKATATISSYQINITFSPSNSYVYTDPTNQSYTLYIDSIDVVTQSMSYIDSNAGGFKTVHLNTDKLETINKNGDLFWGVWGDPSSFLNSTSN